jgi:hypothetical protein
MMTIVDAGEGGGEFDVDVNMILFSLENYLLVIRFFFASFAISICFLY